MLNSLKGKTGNAEAIVESAINRVLGKTTHSTVDGNPHEDTIISALRGLLNTIHTSSFPVQPSTSSKPHHTQQINNQSPTPQSGANQVGTQSSASQQPAKSSIPSHPNPAVARPSFKNWGSPAPRPPEMKSTSSSGESSAAARSSGAFASPAPAQDSLIGTNTPKLSADNGQIAGQKRALDDADDMREYKKLATSGPPQLKT